MRIKAKVEGDKIIIPNSCNLKDGEIWLEIEILGTSSEEHLELWEEHLNEEKRKEEPVDIDTVEAISQELGLKGIKVEDLINGKL
ncbi:MAG TPA: hypothetical protein ENK22_06435 [Persephonella sp.]|nr:hypothetical protein [Persephonella sp.]